MKQGTWVFSFQVFGLVMHLFLLVSLIAIGFFDFLGVGPLAKSSVRLLETLSAAHSSGGALDPLSSRIAVDTADAATLLLSVMRTLCILALVTFVAHVISFRRK